MSTGVLYSFYMPSPEHNEGAGRGDLDPKKEQEGIPYYLASRFNGERPSGQAYFSAQKLIFNSPESELSVYRFQLDRIYHVAVLGDRPEDQSLEDKVKAILSHGESVPLPPTVLKLLIARRQQQTKYGPWNEGHFRPG